jgi:hypothetical protein
LEVSDPGGGDRQVSIVERVREIVEPLLARHSLEVYDIEVSGSQLRVTIDRPAGASDGLDLDAIAQATRLVSLALDEHDPIEAATPSRSPARVSSARCALRRISAGPSTPPSA